MNSINGTTENLSTTQLEALGQRLFSSDKLASFSPFLMGMWMDALALGVMLAVFFRWQSRVAPVDKLWTKLLIYYLMIVNMGISGYVLAQQIQIFVKGFGDFRGPLDTDWTRPSYAASAVSRFPSTCYFIYRAWLLDKTIAIPVLLTPMVLGSMVASFIVTATYTYHPIPLLARQMFYTFTSLEVTANVLITALIIHALLRRTKENHEESQVARVLGMVVESQLPATVNAIVALAVTATLDQTSDTALFQWSTKIQVICLIIVATFRSAALKGEGHRGKLDDSIELASTTGSRNEVRVDRITYVHSEEQQFEPKHSVNRSVEKKDQASPTSPDPHLEYSYPTGKAW